jgi:voltage-gated potassium channel
MRHPDEYLDRRVSRFMQRPPTVVAAGTVIVSFTTVTVVLAGLVMRVFDHSEFHSFGLALWWALQTVTTVGYGDIVPESTFGRIVAALVMLEGIAFLTVVTAVVTSIFIERARRERVGVAVQMPEEIYAAIRSIDERLTRIEQRLGDG